MSEEVSSAVAPEAAPAAAVNEEASEVSSQEEIEAIEKLDAEESSGSKEVIANKEQSVDNKAIKQEAVKQEVDKQVQKWLLKGLNGENIEISDVNDLVKRAQKGLGAELKFQEAAEIKKEAGQLLKMLHEDPLGLLETLGLDTVSLAQDRLRKEMAEKAKSPEEKQRELELKELQTLREEIKKNKEQADNEKYQRMVADQEKAIEEGMITALQSENLPVKPAYIKRMAEVMQAGLEQGVELSPAEALKFARKEIVSDLRELLDASPDEMLEDFIGSSNAKRLRKRYLTKAREQIKTPSQIKSTGESSATMEERESGRPKISIKQWLKN